MGGSVAPRRVTLVVTLGILVSTVVPVLGPGGAAGASVSATAAVHEPRSGYLVYWDQNEEEDYYASATSAEAQLETPWDPNGQMCLLNDGTGRWVVGYDPTNPSQHNPGGPPHHAFKQPPIGEEMNNRFGQWTGLNLFVAGPFRDKKGDPGEDSPPDAKGVFNGQSTYTGCAVDARHNVFADDIGTGQGSFPTPTDGRLVEWFAPSYKQSCILYGPTTGGVDGDHHVDGSGGLAQPGMMAWNNNGDLLLPVAASPTGGLGGQVLAFAHSSFPQSPSQCAGGVYPRSAIKDTVWFQGGGLLPVPMAVAKDPTCDCFAVDTAFGDPSIAWLDSAGQPIAAHPTIPGETISDFGKPSTTAYNPFGMAFAPDGTLYFVDIHIICQGGNLGNCGPTNNEGRVMRVTFTNGQPNPAQQIAGGFDFPTSVTLCVIGKGICPYPSHKTPAPDQGTKAEAGG